MNNEPGIRNASMLLLMTCAVAIISVYLCRTRYFVSVLNKNNTLSVCQCVTYDRALIVAEEISLEERDKIVCVIILQADIRLIDNYIKNCIGSVIYANEKQYAKIKFFRDQDIENAVESFNKSGFTTHFELNSICRIEQILSPHLSSHP